MPVTRRSRDDTAPPDTGTATPSQTPGALLRRWLAPLLAAGLAGLGTVLGWRGVDLSAQVYRITLFRHEGMVLWDSQWYGGHWTFNYSVIFPPVAAGLGVALTAALSAGTAAWAFDRLVVGHFGRTARVGSFAFAVGTAVPVAIGQLPFLLGEALALLACLTAARRRWALAIPLALATAAASPLAAAFLALAVAARLLASWPTNRLPLTGLLVAAAAPLAASALLFPGPGSFPYPTSDFVFEACACVVMLALVPRRERTLRVAAVLYVLATAASYVLHTPMGGNIGRLAESVAIPVGACLLWAHRRVLLVVLAVPMALWQWTPAWGAMTASARDPSTHASYYAPLVQFLQANATPIGRVEIVPTRYHWEVAYVAPDVPLARGWERQLDIADNPLFYRPGLDAAGLRRWLLDNGVRFVAVPDAPLDYAGIAEAQVLAAGVPGLEPVFATPHWQVYAVTGSPGILDGPATLVRLDGSRITIDAQQVGTAHLRVRWNPQWTVTAGSACVQAGADSWTDVDLLGTGIIELDLQLRLRPPSQPVC